VLDTIGLAESYQCRPSSLFDIQDPYTAYCFDEACAYIKAKIKAGEQPVFREQGNYSSLSEFYSKINRR